MACGRMLPWPYSSGASCAFCCLILFLQSHMPQLCCIGAAGAAAELEVVVQQLSEANEQLHLRAAKVSEAELQEIQQEATDRLAAAERKVCGCVWCGVLLAAGHSPGGFGWI